MKTVEALLEGRDRIASGFCKNAASRSIGGKTVQWCAVGAVSWHAGAVEALYPHLPEEWHHRAYNWVDRWDQVVEYNNDPETTQADMVALFEKALSELGGLG